MKWYYGGICLGNSGGTVKLLAHLTRGRSEAEVVGMCVQSDEVKKVMRDGFQLGDPKAYEVPADTVRQMAIDYGVLPEGGGK